jgi:hypothetical protein
MMDSAKSFLRGDLIAFFLGKKRKVRTPLGSIAGNTRPSFYGED